MIGNRIRMFRKERGLTQGQLGRGILSVSYISQIENNQKEVPNYLLPEIAKRLDVSVEELVGKDEKRKREYVKSKINEAVELFYRDRLDEYNQILKEIIPEITDLKKDEEVQIEFALLEAMFLLRFGDSDQFEEKIQQFKEFTVSKYPSLFYRFIRIMGAANFQKGFFLRSIDLYKRAKELESQLKDIEMESALLSYNMALSYWQLSDQQKAFYFVQEAIDKFNQLGNWYSLSVCMNLLGLIYYKQSQWEMAIEQFEKVLKLTKEIPAKYLQAKALHNIGLIYDELKDMEKAHKYWLESLQIRKELGNEKDILMALHSLAYSYFILGSYNLFLVNINEIEARLKETDFPIIEAKSYHLLGDYYYQVEKNKKYKEYYNLAIQAYEKGNFHLEAANLSFELATITAESYYYRKSAELYNQHHKRLENN